MLSFSLPFLFFFLMHAFLSLSSFIPSDFFFFVFVSSYTIAYGGYNRLDPSAHLQWLASAVSCSSDFVQTFQSLAKNLSMAIAVTYLQQWQPTPRNVVTLFDRFGNEVFTYAKVREKNERKTVDEENDRTM